MSNDCSALVSTIWNDAHALGGQGIGHGVLCAHRTEA
jgi:hypothetical protein